MHRFKVTIRYGRFVYTREIFSWSIRAAQELAERTWPRASSLTVEHEP